jgi:hypothetical protein
MQHTLSYLLKIGLISQDSSEKLKAHYDNKPMSIHWHVRLILYLGVTLLSAGFGTLIYKNIDSIGHIGIVTVIGLVTAGSLFYCFKKAPPFTIQKSESSNSWLDYILLLGVSSFLTFEGYLQFQFGIFGTHYGLATIIPALFLFFIAYRFDHLGVLALAITLFASWMGIALTPKELIATNDFSDISLVRTGLTLSALLAAVGYLHHNRNIKPHFSFSYYNFALHLGAVATLVATFALDFDYGWIWIGFLIPIVALGYLYSIKDNSFYFLLFSAIYGYIGISYLVIRVMILMDDIIVFYLLFIYFIISAIFGLMFLKRAHKKMTAS